MVEGCRILNHSCPWLGWGDIVGMHVGCCMRPESPAAGSHGETRSVGPKGGAEGWCIIDGMGRWSGHWWCTLDCTQEDGFVHAPRVAAHGIHTSGSALMMFARVGTRRAGVVVIHIAAVHVAIMPVFEMLDGVCCHSVGSGSAAAAAKAPTIVAATTTVVASAAAAVIASAAAVAIPIEDLGAAAARSSATESLALSAAAGRVHTLLLVIGHHVGGGDGIRALGRSSESAPALH